LTEVFFNANIDANIPQHGRISDMETNSGWLIEKQVPLQVPLLERPSQPVPLRLPDMAG
jgi:hypothetical protein